MIYFSQHNTLYVHLCCANDKISFSFRAQQYSTEYIYIHIHTYIYIYHIYTHTLEYIYVFIYIYLYIYFIYFIYIYLYIYISFLSIHLSMSTLGFFHILAIMNNSAIYIYRHLFKLVFLFSLEKYSGLELLDHMVGLFLIF